jgi:hypothetical protein
MIDNILSNAAKLVSQFLEFKYIFYEFYKFGLYCCAVYRTLRQNGGPSAKSRLLSGLAIIQWNLPINHEQ